MKVVIRTNLDVSLIQKKKYFNKDKDVFTSLTIDEYKKRLLEAFQTKDTGQTDTIPEPWSNECMLFSQDLEGKARFIVFDVNQDSNKSTSYLSFSLLIVGEEDEPSAQKCIELFLRRVDLADSAASGIKIKVHDAFRLFPLNANGEIDDEGHYYIAKLTDKKKPSFEAFAISSLITLLLFIIYGHFQWDWLLTLAGIPIGVIGTFIWEITRMHLSPSQEVSIDINETLNKESEHIRNRTDKIRDTYSNPVERLTRSEGKQDARFV